MTPKEKAEELIDKYFSAIPIPLSETILHNQSKRNALIAVDEILKLAEVIDKSFSWFPSEEGDITYIQYWQQVKQEIEKL